MEATARAPVAISLVNGIVAGHGAAAAIDRHVRANVRLDPDGEAVTASVADGRDVDTTLVRRVVEVVCERVDASMGGHVETRADVPPSVGLKTSSAVANATAAATLAALDEWSGMDDLDAARLGVEVAREVGVTITGAFDDASACMLGGVTLADTATDALIARHELTRSVTVLVPEGRRPTASVDPARLRAYGPLGAHAADLVADERYDLAMAINGLATTAALRIDPAPLYRVEGLVTGVSPSGTGPAVAAMGDPETCRAVAKAWEPLGHVIETALTPTGLRVR